MKINKKTTVKELLSAWERGEKITWRGKRVTSINVQDGWCCKCELATRGTARRVILMWGAGV